MRNTMSSQPSTPSEPLISIDEYFSNYSRNRNLDKVIWKWHVFKYPAIFQRTKTEWDKIMSEFNNETEK